MAISRRALASRAALPAAVLLGLLGSGGLVWQSTSAAFTSKAVNPTNSFSAGGVTLTESASGSSLFSVGNLVPGSSGTTCVDVTYSGTVAADVRFYANSNVYALAPYLIFQVDQIANSAPCSNATAAVANLYGSGPSDDLNGLLNSANWYGAGLGSWTPSTTQTRRYRFEYGLRDDDDAQNKSVQVDFTWEARSTS